MNEQPLLDTFPLDRRMTEAELAMCDCRLSLRELLRCEWVKEMKTLGLEPDTTTMCIKVSANWKQSEPLPQEVQAFEKVFQRFNISLADLAKDPNVSSIVPSTMMAWTDYVGKPVRPSNFLDAGSCILLHRIYAGRIAPGT